MQIYEVQFARDFVDKVQSVYDYVVEKYDDPINARKLIEAIERRCRRLAVFPKGYAVRIVRNGLEFRFVHIRKFTVVFTVDEKRRKVTVRTLIYPGGDFWRELG